MKFVTSLAFVAFLTFIASLVNFLALLTIFFEKNSHPAWRGERLNKSTGLRWQMHVIVYITNIIDVLGQIQEAW